MAKLNRNADGTMTVVFSDDTEAVFNTPKRSMVAQGMLLSRENPFAFADVLIDQCLVKGEKAILKEMPYLGQLGKLTDETYGRVFCILDLTEQGASLEYVDGKVVNLRLAKRKELAEFQSKLYTKPLQAYENILANCRIGGDNGDMTLGHVLGFIENWTDFMSASYDVVKN